MSKNPENCQNFLNELVKKVTKNQDYILSSENTILEKPQEEGGEWAQIDQSAFHFVEIFHLCGNSVCFVYIFIVGWNFLIKFFDSDPSFNRNILTSLYLKSETSAHAQLHHYLFTHTIYTLHDMVSFENLH